MSVNNIIDFAHAHTEAERYRPAEEKIISGDCEQTVYNHYESPCGRFASGVWEGGVGHWRVHYTEHEYCEILAGVSVLHDEAGGSKTLRAGDRFVIPAGFRGSWEVVEPCRKIYALFEAQG